MKHLIIYAHPNPLSFNHTIMETAVQALKARSHQVDVRDLYKLNFQPVFTTEDWTAIRSNKPPMDILIEQDYITQSDVITFIYPIWWTGPPAILKGYLDRVYSDGFAYKIDPQGNIQGLLAGKKAFIINTHGASNEVYESTRMRCSLKQTSDEGIFEFCGVEMIDHLFLGGMDLAGADERSVMLRQVEKALQQIF